ncbi:MAG: MATE family efflux transporter [Myxococcota bacterium]
MTSPAAATPRLKDELGALLNLAWPMMLAQGGIMLMSTVDTIVVGHDNATDMAGVALGAGVTNTIGVFGIGVAMGIEALVGQAHGAGEGRRARSWMWQGLYVGLWVSAAMIAILAFAHRFFVSFGINPEMARAASRFIDARLVGVPAYAVMAGLRAYLSNTGRRWPIVLAVASANVMNLCGDLILVRGWFGAPKLGALGVGISTTVSTIFMATIMAFAVRAIAPTSGPSDEAEVIRKQDREMMRRVFRIGWPVGMQAAVENGVFMAAAWMIGTMGDRALSAHSIALTACSLTFMMVLGIANAATARVGMHVGRGDSPAAGQAGLLSIGLGASFMAVTGGFFLSFPELAARVFTEDEAVIQAAIPLVRMAGVFALSDGIQGVSAGALRGIGETDWPFWANLSAHWLIGFPLGIWLGTVRGMGPVGYWWGLSAGLTGVAITLALRFYFATRRPLVRLEHSQPSSG